MIIRIENKVIDAATFVVPPMGLSSSKASMKSHTFEAQVNKSVIIDLMGTEYNQWVIESKEDDALYHEPQDELGEAGYPDIDQVLENKELTELVFGDYLVRELFEKVTGNGHFENFTYWFDEVSTCTIHSDAVIFTGTCFIKIS